MSLNHEFLLMPKDMANQVTPLDYELTTRPDLEKCVLHDDILGYLGDSLGWIPTRSLGYPEQTYGLNRCGITLIGSEGAPIMRRILRAWMDLFGNGPKMLHLTGDYGWHNSGTVVKGEYETLVLERDILLHGLNSLCLLCEKALSEGLVVVHFGL